MIEHATATSIHKLTQPVVLFLFWLCCSTTAASTVSPVSAWKFAQEISPTQRNELNIWLAEVQIGLNRLLGPSPNQHEIHTKYQHSRGSPMPWAQTAKGTMPQVHMYVDVNQPSSTFRNDWTTAHELTHMLLPYTGCCNHASPTSAEALPKLFDEAAEANLFQKTYPREMLTDKTPNIKTLGTGLRVNPPEFSDSSN